MEHDINVMRICVYTYFEHLRHLKENVHEIEARIREIRSSIELKAIVYSSMPGGPSTDGDKFGNALARLENANAEWDAAIDNLYIEYDKMMRLCLPSYLGRYALWLHKVEHHSWEYVGRITGYSESHIKRIGYEAIPEMYELIPESFRRSSIPNAI